MIRIRRSWERGLDRMRLRMIRETEIALAIGLRFPDRAIRIPTMEVGVGSFDPTYADRFWADVLETECDTNVSR